MSDELKRRLAEAKQQLAAEYGQRLPTRIEELVGALDAIEGPAHEPSIEAARALAHKLKGTSGSYGFHEVSRIAGGLEDALESILEGNDRWSEVHSLREELGAHLD